MKYSIDKIECDIATLENIQDGTKIDINIEKLPSDIKEGSIIIENSDGFILDVDEEELRRQKMQERFNKLKKN